MTAEVGDGVGVSAFPHRYNQNQVFAYVIVSVVVIAHA